MRKLFRAVSQAGGFAIVFALLTGCASTPQYRYYTIDMQPRAQVESAVRVSDISIRVNQALSKAEILVRTSPTQIEYYALDRWASGLEEQVAEKLKTEFGRLPQDLPAVELVGTLMAFEQVDTSSGANVRVKLEIESINPIKELKGFFPSFRKIYERTEPAAAPNAVAAVEALSRATEAIAVELGKDLGGFVKKASEN